MDFMDFMDAKLAFKIAVEIYFFSKDVFLVTY